MERWDLSMLSFYDNEVYFDFEINVYDEFYATTAPYCNKKDAANVFPKLKLFDKINKANMVENGEAKRFLFTPAEYRGFIKAWCEHTTVQKMYNWDYAVFYVEYVNTLKDISRIDDECGFYGGWNSDLENGVFNEIKNSIVANIRVSDMTESPIVINSMCEPEYSMKIEDALYALKHGISSVYTNEVNELIQYNIRKMLLVKKLYENFSAGEDKSIFQADIKLDPTMTIDDIDYSNPNCIFYFYYYSFLPGFSTNLLHLKRVLEEMAK